MVQFITLSALLIIADGNRIIQEHDIKEDVQNKFFESCDDLHDIFHRRVVAVEQFLDVHPNATGMNAMNRARFTMRSFGVVRTLRRAKDCPWASDGNSEDIEHAQSIVQATLAGNPCAAAAMSEMTPEAYESAANELIPLQRAMLVLVSDTCTVPELEIIDAGDLQDMEARTAQNEDQAQDTIDELFEEAAMENESGTTGSLMQTEGFVGRIFAWTGAIFFAIAFGMACAAGGWFFGLIIGWFIGALVCETRSCGPGSQDILGFMIAGAAAGGTFGFAGCASLPILEMTRRN